MKFTRIGATEIKGEGYKLPNGLHLHIECDCSIPLQTLNNLPTSVAIVEIAELIGASLLNACEKEVKEWKRLNSQKERKQ